MADLCLLQKNTRSSQKNLVQCSPGGGGLRRLRIGKTALRAGHNQTLLFDDGEILEILYPQCAGQGKRGYKDV